MGCHYSADMKTGRGSFRHVNAREGVVALARVVGRERRFGGARTRVT